MLRLAERHKVPRKAFLDAYIDHETEEGWLERVGKQDKKWVAFAAAEADSVTGERTSVWLIVALPWRPRRRGRTARPVMRTRRDQI